MDAVVVVMCYNYLLTRCAELSLVAIVNKLPELWMSLDHVVVVGVSFNLAVDINVQGVPNYPW